MRSYRNHRGHGDGHPPRKPGHLHRPAGTLTPALTPGSWLQCESVCGWQAGKAELDDRITLKPSENISVDASDWPEGIWMHLPRVRVASGEAFIASESNRGRVRAETSANLVEMNAFGLMAALHERKIKLLVLRVVSDQANEAAASDFANFLGHYDGAGGKMAASILRLLPVSKDDPEAYDDLKRLLDKSVPD